MAESMKELKRKIEDLERKIRILEAEKESLQDTLNRIYSSRAWKLVTKYYSLKNIFLNLIRKESAPKDNRECKDYLLKYREKILPKRSDRLDILFFSIIDWNFRTQRPQHIARRLARKGYRIFYIKTTLKADKNISYKKIEENIYEITLPYSKSTTIYNEDLKEGFQILKSGLEELFSKFSIKESVAFVQFPTWFRAVEFLKDNYWTKIVFDVLDEFSGFSNVHQDVEILEKKLIELADAITTTSEHLMRKIKSTKSNANIHLIRNATEYESFSNLPQNDLLKNLKKPIIGYYGAIAEWFDSEAIYKAAIQHPEWNFVLIGHTFGSDISKLKKLKNVYLLGEKPYEDLPKYLYWFDVCLIPFKESELIKSTNPVKLYEYFSAGKPVVSFYMPELEPCKNLLYIAENRDDFVKKIEEALAEQDELKRQGRKDFARRNDWNERVEKLEEVIQSVFPKVSIVVLTYNNLKYNKLCIESILEKTAYPNYELIIVDNNSTDGTRDFLKELKNNPKIKVILNNANLGFAKGNNIGIKNSDGDHVILLNNDTVVTRGWIGGLIKHLKDEKVGMVGPVTNSIGNEAKINVAYDNIADIEPFAECYTELHWNETFEITTLAMFCVAIKREVINKVGYLDENYQIGMFEDDDYSMAVKRAGYKLLCAEDVFIHHFGSVSFRRLEDKEFKKIFEENRSRFEKKWNTRWKPHKYRPGVT